MCGEDMSRLSVWFTHDCVPLLFLHLLAVAPHVQIDPRKGVGVHTGETVALTCSGSGFPRPLLRWVVEEVHISGQLPQEMVSVSEYNTTNQLRIDGALPDASGTYACRVCYEFSESSGECDRVEAESYVSVRVYGKLFLL